MNITKRETMSSTATSVATVIDCTRAETKSVVFHSYPTTSIIEDPFKLPFTYGSIPPVTSTPYIHIGVPTPVPVAGALQYGSLHSYCKETFYVLVPNDVDSLTVGSIVLPKNRNYTMRAMGEHESMTVQHGMIIMTVVGNSLYAITVITAKNVIHGPLRKQHWMNLLVVIRHNVSKIWDTIYVGGIDAFAAVYRPDRVHSSFMDSGYFGVLIVEQEKDLPQLFVQVKEEPNDSGSTSAAGKEEDHEEESTALLPAKRERSDDDAGCTGGA